MKIEKIKPIPKYILKQILRLDKQTFQDSRVRYYAYFTTNDKELVKVTVAVKNYHQERYYKQVAIHGLNSTECFVKDMGLTYLGAYVVDWYEEGIQKTPKRCYSDGWWQCEDKYFDMYAPTINKEYVYKFEELKYCAIEQYHQIEIMKYLRIYLKYPEAEYFVKGGFEQFATSTTLLKQARKDKAFRKWLFRNRDEINKGYFYVNTILKGYKTGKPLREIQYIEKEKLQLYKCDAYLRIKDYITDIEKFINYIDKQETDYYSYIDYIRACEELGIDLTVNKNLYPHDFKKWHDIRIDEYHTLLAKRDEEKRKEFYESFSKVANKYLSLEKTGKDMFVAIIAKSPNDLVREGKLLHHCVGKMGYDQKFAREETLIFFIRTKEDKDTPLVTLEYSIKQHKVLQCYGDNDSKPSDDVMNFVNKKWLPYANRQMKKLVA